MRRDGHETEKQCQVPEEEACVFEEDQGAEEAKQAYRQNELGMALGMTLGMARFRQHVAFACHLFYECLYYENWKWQARCRIYFF